LPAGGVSKSRLVGSVRRTHEGIVNSCACCPVARLCSSHRNEENGENEAEEVEIEVGWECRELHLKREVKQDVQWLRLCSSHRNKSYGVDGPAWPAECEIEVGLECSGELMKGMFEQCAVGFGLRSATELKRMEIACLPAESKSEVGLNISYKSFRTIVRNHHKWLGPICATSLPIIIGRPL